jgi:NhaA family Na+:H+ antiporter
MKRAFRYAVGQSLLVPSGAAIALAWANGGPESYFRVASGLAFAVNDVGMALFFMVIAQEVLEATMPGGALDTWRRATLPIVAAVGGTIGAIGMYEGFVMSGDERLLVAGWPVVCGIDGALAYVVAEWLFGKSTARPFVLLMVIVSNAIGLIAIGVHPQSVSVHPAAGPLLIALGLIVCAGTARIETQTGSIWLLIASGGAMLWLGFWWSGLHPALSLVPMVPFLPRSPRKMNLFSDVPNGAHDSPQHVEHALRIPVQIVLLLFALVNAGTPVHGLERGTWAVPVGALAGRPLGTVIAVIASVGLGLRLPHRLGWRELVVIALTVSCSFTSGLFFAAAVFPMGPVLIEAKVGALSTIAGALVATSAAWLLGVGRFERSGRVRGSNVGPRLNHQSTIGEPLLPKTGETAYKG